MKERLEEIAEIYSIFIKIAIDEGMKEAINTHEYLDITREEINDLIFLFIETPVKSIYYDKAYKFLDGSIDKPAVMSYFFKEEYETFF